MNSEMYNRGLDAGTDYARGICFGIKPAPEPEFESAVEELDYLDGFDDGFRSIDN